jgi:hypothetical protein
VTSGGAGECAHPKPFGGPRRKPGEASAGAAGSGLAKGGSEPWERGSDDQRIGGLLMVNRPPVMPARELNTVGTVVVCAR